MDSAAFDRTAEIAQQFKVITQPASPESYRTDLAEAAHEGLDGDAKGTDFKKGSVEVTPGGE
jgi:hypothetical protein